MSRTLLQHAELAVFRAANKRGWKSSNREGFARTLVEWSQERYWMVWNRGFRVGVLAGGAAVLTLTFGIVYVILVNWVRLCA